jgi:hypothetical protein
MTWRPNPEQSASWSAAGGVITIVGTGATLTLALGPPSAHVSSLLVFACGALSIVGAYVMLAPLFSWGPWSASRPRAPRLLAMAMLITLAFVALNGGARKPRVRNLHVPSKVSKVTNATKRPTTGAGKEPSGMVTYVAGRFTAKIPVGWLLHENELAKEGEIESTWHNPANTHDLILIDFKPARYQTPHEDAEPEHAKLLKEPAYQEKYYGPGDLDGVESWMWIFQVGEQQSIDYFFTRCSTTYAVLGSSTQSRFTGLRQTFRWVAQSVMPKCRK